MLDGVLTTIQKRYDVTPSMMQKLRTAIEEEKKSARAEGYNQGYEEGGKGKITWDRARDLAETYPGGESTHPLSRHRDSMG
jgi:hypothetical protein